MIASEYDRESDEEPRLLHRQGSQEFGDFETLEIDDVSRAGSGAGSEEDALFTPTFCKWPGIRHIVLALFRSDEGMPRLRHPQWEVLFAVAAVNVFAGFDYEVLPIAMLQIQRSLNLPEADLGFTNAVVKLGGLPSLLFALGADVCGRRNVLLISAALFCFVSTGSALSGNIVQFTSLQFLARMFIQSKSTIATTMLVETMEQHNRGWALGFSQSMGALGAGLCYLAFGIFGSLENGWRIMYGLAVLQLPFLLHFYKKLPESSKFLQEKDAEVMPLQQRIRLLFGPYRTRSFASFASSALGGFAFAPGDLFQVKFLQEVHGLTPPKVAVLVFTIGLMSFVSFTLAGRMSDKIGRKLFLVVFGTISTFGTFFFFISRSWVFIIFFFAQVQSGFVLMVVSNVFFAECFPTVVRSTAQSLFTICAVVSGIASIALESVLYRVTEDHYVILSWLALVHLPAPFIIYKFMPESSNRDLDELSPSHFTILD